MSSNQKNRKKKSSIGITILGIAAILATVFTVLIIGIGFGVFGYFRSDSYKIKHGIAQAQEYITNQQNEEAVELLKGLYDTYGSDDGVGDMLSFAYFSYAHEYGDAGDYMQALTILLDALSLDPSNEQLMEYYNEMNTAYVLSLEESYGLTQEPVEEPTEEPDASMIPVNYWVEHDSALYANYNQTLYYRQYSLDDMTGEALFGYFTAARGEHEKDLMYITSDHKVGKAGVNDGYGEMYIINDRIYSQKMTENGSVAYSCDIDGANPLDYDGTQFIGMDESAGILYYIDNEFKLSAVNAFSGETYVHISSVQIQFIEMIDNKVYYYGPDEGQSIALFCCSYDTKEVKLAVMSVDLLTDPDLGANYLNYIDISCIQKVGDQVYFNFGGYAGTGNFYQGGLIARVDTNGDHFEILVDYPVCTDENFYVKVTPSGNELYYNTFEDGEYACQCLPLDGNTQSGTMDCAYPLGYVFVDDNYDLKVYMDETGTVSNLLSEEEYASLGYGNFRDAYEYTYEYGTESVENNAISETYFDIIDVEYTDGLLFFTIVNATHNPDGDVGWRYDYFLDSMTLFCKNMETGEIVKVYEY